MVLNDREAALLATAVYYEKPYKEMRDKNIPAGWEKKDLTEHSGSGLLCILFVKVIYHQIYGLRVFSSKLRTSKDVEYSSGLVRKRKKRSNDDSDFTKKILCLSGHD